MISTGTFAGSLLVDGLGDGVLIDAPHEDLDFLRTLSFGLLQASAVSSMALPPSWPRPCVPCPPQHCSLVTLSPHYPAPSLPPSFIPPCTSTHTVHIHPCPWLLVSILPLLYRTYVALPLPGCRAAACSSCRFLPAVTGLALPCPLLNCRAQFPMLSPCCIFNK